MCRGELCSEIERCFVYTIWFGRPILGHGRDCVLWSDPRMIPVPYFCQLVTLSWFPIANYQTCCGWHFPSFIGPYFIVSFNYGNYDHFRQPHPCHPYIACPSTFISYVVLICFIVMYWSPPHTSCFTSLRLNSAWANGCFCDRLLEM